MTIVRLPCTGKADVIHILKKQRQELERLEIEVEGERADAVPAVFTKIHLRFTAYGKLAAERMFDKWRKDGALVKYVVNVKGTVSFGGQDRDIDRTTTTEFKKVGSTKVSVPDEAKKKLGS